jgi:glutamate mutase epsilon subunit
MGALLIVKVSRIELHEIVNEENSMDKIGQALLKYIIDSHVRLRRYFEGLSEEVKERCN